MSDTSDAKIGFLRKKTVPGDIGIELELEGALFIPDMTEKFWMAIPEASLRQGYEYVLKAPLPVTQVPEALKDMDKILKRGKPKTSIRCSTHIHISVNELTVREVYNVLAAYYLVEDLLVGTQGPLRIGNLHCLRMSDAEGLAFGLVESWVRKKYFQYFKLQHWKYGALNLASVNKLGSLEFRFMKPLIDMEEMAFWVYLLYEFVHKMKSVPIAKTIRRLEAYSTLDFLRKTFSNEQVGRLVSQYAMYNSAPLTDLFEETAPHVYELDRVVSRRRFKKKSAINKDTGMPMTIYQATSLAGISAMLDSDDVLIGLYGGVVSDESDTEEEMPTQPAWGQTTTAFNPATIQAVLNEIHQETAQVQAAQAAATAETPETVGQGGGGHPWVAQNPTETQWDSFFEDND